MKKIQSMAWQILGLLGDWVNYRLPHWDCSQLTRDCLICAEGDLLFLDGRWYVTHSGLLG